MPDPLKPLNTTVWGGVKVDTHRVAKFSKVRGGLGHVRGTDESGKPFELGTNIHYVIDFKNGTRVEYPKQKDGAIRFSPHTDFDRLYAARITASPDFYDLYGCKYCKIDTSNGPSFVDLSSYNKGGHNKVIQGKDSATYLDYVKGSEYDSHYSGLDDDDVIMKIYGEGTINQDDYEKND